MEGYRSRVLGIRGQKMKKKKKDWKEIMKERLKDLGYFDEEE